MELPKIKLTKQQQKEVEAYKEGYNKGFKQGINKGEKDTIKRIDKLIKEGRYE